MDRIIQVGTVAALVFLVAVCVLACKALLDLVDRARVAVERIERGAPNHPREQLWRATFAAVIDPIIRNEGVDAALKAPRLAGLAKTMADLSVTKYESRWGESPTTSAPPLLAHVSNVAPDVAPAPSPQT